MIGDEYPLMQPGPDKGQSTTIWEPPHVDLRSELCKTCIHTKVCMRDKNILGDVFVPGHPYFFDNEELYAKYEERKKAGFPCDEYLPIKEEDDD